MPAFWRVDCTTLRGVAMQFFRLTVMLTALFVSISASNLFAQQPPPGAQRVLGVFPGEDGLTHTVIAPDQVRVGQEFPVTITTVGGGCDEAGDNGVIQGSSAASIYVYDYTTANLPNVVCPAILKTFRHEVVLSFSEPGAAVIRVWGRRTGRYEPHGGSPAVLEVKIRVLANDAGAVS